jgi:hypothetical protein
LSYQWENVQSLFIKAGAKQARRGSDLRQAVGMNVQILISNLCGAKGVAQACGNQIF